MRSGGCEAQHALVARFELEGGVDGQRANALIAKLVVGERDA